MGQRQEHSPGIESWMRVIRAEGVGPTTFRRLRERYHDLEKVPGLSVAELCRIEGVGTRTAERIRASLDAFDAGAELALADKLGVWILHLDDARYPPALKAIYDPPPVLYVRGTLGREDNLAVAIVGSRRCTAYGQEQASRFAHLLAASGLTVVSGLARGIDTAAHRGALSAKGRTIAVLGCGLGHCYPPENQKLLEQVIENGACVSELPLGYYPQSENFPARNRIIAGLTMGTLVVEASNRSGALITAKEALEQNREVMAIPGRIDSPASIGTHRLLKQGARLVDSVQDVMEALGYIGEGLKDHVGAASQEAQRKAEAPLFAGAKPKLRGDEEKVYGCLDHQAVHIEEVIVKTGLDAGKVNSLLIALQLKGLVKQLPGSLFLKR